MQGANESGGLSSGGIGARRSQRSSKKRRGEGGTDDGFGRGRGDMGEYDDDAYQDGGRNVTGSQGGIDSDLIGAGADGNGRAGGSL